MNCIPKNILGRIPVLLITLACLTACDQPKTPKEKPVVKKTSLCSCSATEGMSSYFPIDAEKDSVVICNKATMTFFDNNQKKTASYVDFFKQHTLALQGRIWDCGEGTELKFKFYDNTIAYKNKHLVVLSNKMYYLYNPQTKLLDKIKFLPTYSQDVYAENGVLTITEPKLVLKPEPLPPAAIKLIHEKFEKIASTRSHIYPLQLANWLMAGALSGDSFSEERLLNFNKYFTVPADNMRHIKDDQAILNDLRRSKKK